MRQYGVYWWLCLATTIAVPRAASAQTIGLGPRISQIRDGVAASGAPTRLFGGTLRVMSSKHIAFEGTLDYHAEYSDDRSLRMRETPLQGSLLIFPVRRAFSPYLLGGLGLYTRHTDTLGPTGDVLESVKVRKTGWHLGLGAEMFVARHAAIFADYRWRFVHFGEPEAGEDPIDIPVLDDVKLSHRGSMWSGGLAFYF